MAKLVKPGIYLSYISLGVFTPNIHVPYMPDVILDQLTEVDALEEKFKIDKETMTITRVNTGEVHKITKWENTGLTFEPFEMSK